MIHPASELRYVSPAIGYGVFATRFIPKGTFTWVLDSLDQTILQATMDRLPSLLQGALDKYSYHNRRGDRILCWDHSRFLNHSCNPTSLAPGFDLEIAVRDIEEGEEITDDYGSLNLETPFECACGSESCRGTIRPDDFDLYSQRWDALLAEAFTYAEQVEQPLWNLVAERASIKKVLAGERKLPSCRFHLLGKTSVRTTI
jgi:uncharacterized protein